MTAIRFAFYHLDGFFGAFFFLVEHLIKCEPVKSRYKPLSYIPKDSTFHVKCNNCLKYFAW